MASEAEDRSSSLRGGTKKLPGGSFFSYNSLVSHKYIFPLLVIMFACSSCGINISNENAFTATPDFVTATLPPTQIPPSTQTPIPTALILNTVEAPITSTVEGTTTTQLNIRAEPSTASETLGMIDPFAQVQIIGKESSGTWYQIAYPQSEMGKGWVRAEFVQVNVSAEIPLITVSAGSGLGVNGLVIQKINVRNGPGINYESLGTLNPKDVIFVTGKDSSGKWIQFEFINGAGGKGWGALEFLQVDNIDVLPIIGDAAHTPAVSTPASIRPAVQDGDSMQAPLANIIFSAAGTRTLQVNNSISTPDGDLEDWFQFTTFGRNVLVEIKCTNNAFHMELWNNGQYMDEIALLCGESRLLKLETGQPYVLHLQAAGSGFQIIQYSLKITAAQ